MAGWPSLPRPIVVATGAKASATEPDGVDDDERMAKAMPAAAISGAIVLMVGQDGDVTRMEDKGKEKRVIC